MWRRAALRDFDHPANLDAAAHLAAELRAAGARVQERPFTVGGREYRDVVAEVDPEADERMVVGANYHTAADLPETLDNARVAEVVRGVRCAVQAAVRPLTHRLTVTPAGPAGRRAGSGARRRGTGRAAASPRR